MALADFHYTTGISSGFKVYILEGQPSFENEKRFRRLPAYRLPVYTIKRKFSADVRSPDGNLEGQKVLKIRRSAFGPIAISPKKVASPASQILDAAAAVSCVTMPQPEPCRDSRMLHPSCPHKCPLREPPLDPALTVTQLQQMRPSVITCAPRRNCQETPVSNSHPQIFPVKHRNKATPNSPHSQKLHAWTISSAAGSSTQLSGEASPKRRSKEANKNL